jgi:hypothetical protein
MVWTGLLWIRIGTSGGLLWTPWWNLGLHKILGNSWVAASQEGLSSVDLVIIFFMALPTNSGLRPLIQFCNHFSQTVTLLGQVISPSQGRYLNAEHKHRINTYTHQTSMPWVGFEPTIPASERAKTVHALDRAATVIGSYYITNTNTI